MECSLNETGETREIELGKSPSGSLWLSPIGLICLRPAKPIDLLPTLIFIEPRDNIYAWKARRTLGLILLLLRALHCHQGHYFTEAAGMHHRNIYSLNLI